MAARQLQEIVASSEFLTELVFKLSLLKEGFFYFAKWPDCSYVVLPTLDDNYDNSYLLY